MSASLGLEHVPRSLAITGENFLKIFYFPLIGDSSRKSRIGLQKTHWSFSTQIVLWISWILCTSINYDGTNQSINNWCDTDVLILSKYFSFLLKIFFLNFQNTCQTDRLWITEILFTNVKWENIFFCYKNIFSMKIICSWNNGNCN